ncbi:MAG: endonuclease III [Chlamydiae bacterium]|nr:endonuclease III [Chlamydiota bacterium]MBI3266194.1 endonuclease III [Chlamydiota bacterium]
MNLELTPEDQKRIRMNVMKVHDLLQEKHGRLVRDGKKGPLDELVFTILAQNTTPLHSQEAFERLKKKFRNWEGLMAAPVGEISSAIQKGGLNHTKALRIRRILGRIYRDRKELSLDFLREMEEAQALKYLLSLKGIGVKTASHVLLYSLNRPVMPIDTHVERVSKRLGWVWNHAPLEAVQEVIHCVAPRYLVLSLHSQLMKHGRVTCKVKNPRCPRCVIRACCDFYKKKVGICT